MSNENADVRGDWVGGMTNQNADVRSGRPAHTMTNENGDVMLMSWNGWAAHTMTHRTLGLILRYMSNYESEGYFR